MSEKGSSTPKRAPRRRKVAEADAPEVGSPMDVTPEVASRPLPRAIDDALGEAAAAREEFSRPPTEADMDFEAAPPPPRRGRPPRSRAASRPAAEPSAPADEADGPVRAGAVYYESAPEAPRAREVRPETPADDFGGEVLNGNSTGHSDADGGGGEFAPNQGGGSGEPGQEGGDSFQQRRRRRRRGRGYEGGPQGGGQQGGGQHGGQPGGGHQGGGGPRYQQGGGPRHQQQGRFRQGPPQHGGPRRHGPPQRGYGNQQGYSNEPREPRGPEGPATPVQGILELHPKGYGFLRDQKAGYFSQETDPFVSSSLIEKFSLREGLLITGEMVAGGRGQGPRLKQIDTIEGKAPDEYKQMRSFEELTPITPYQQIKLETGTQPVTMRVMDLLTPIGKGQRALLVAPPRSGKTILLQEIADSVSKNHPEVYLIVLLIDERPEEVTEMKRRVRGEVIASSLDREVESHIRVSQLVFERAKRMTESGRDVFLLLDSITRTARAFNKWSNSGRTGTGGLDIRAMDIPKKMFGLARQFEEGGSLTVVGTALIDTGSRMDDAIFQEFKGTGNMEMVLSRDLADRRIWPAIDITKSGTRREEKILSPEVLEGVTLLRRSLVSLQPVEAMEQLIKTLGKFPTNADFLAKIKAIM
ncbi:MAG TPA: transcription termination factor Rho [Planctomycetaceae bacterium]|nr:transcription termination factor Rho [Planctomycetaceae bacterium]